VPRRRWKISNSECFRYKSVIRELNRGGARLELGPLQPQTLEVSFFDCYARTVERGSVYVTSLSILGLAQRTILTCFELASAQFDLMVDFSEESWLSRAEEKIYRLPDQTTFHRNEVLNHRTGRKGIVHRGHQIEGVLLAQSLNPIPEQYPTGSRLPAVLSIGDPFGDVTEWPLHFRVQAPYSRPLRPATRLSVFDGLGKRITSKEPSLAKSEDLLASTAESSKSCRFDGTLAPEK
jgi:hypothetical protein